LKISHPAFR